MSGIVRNATDVPRLALRLDEAAAAIGLSRRAFWGIVARGEGPPFTKLGRVYAFPVRDMEEWLRRRAAVEGDATNKLPHRSERESV